MKFFPKPSFTINTYNQHASRFATYFEQMLDTHQLDDFLSQLKDNGPILDAGCGTARDSSYFIKKGYKSLAIDASQGMLDEAKKLHPEVPIECMDLRKIILPEKSFSGVWSKASLLHLEREFIPKVLKEFHRILKSEGILFIQTKVGKGTEVMNLPFDLNAKREFTLLTEEELIELLEDAGFKVFKQEKLIGTASVKEYGTQEWIVIFAKKP